MAIRAPDGANKVCSRLVDVFRLFHVLPSGMAGFHNLWRSGQMSTAFYSHHLIVATKL